MDDIKELLVKNGYIQYENIWTSFRKNFGNSYATVIVRYNDVLAVSLRRKDKTKERVIFDGIINNTEEQVKAFISLVDDYNRLFCTEEGLIIR